MSVGNGQLADGYSGNDKEDGVDDDDIEVTEAEVIGKLGKIIEQLMTEKRRVELNMRALGAAWRSSWADFDGVALHYQVDAILAGSDEGTRFYHDHVTRDLGDDKCPWECLVCEREGKR